MSTARASIALAVALCAGRAAAAPPGYPPTRRDPTVDQLHGETIADPYRWLEQLDSPATREWVRAQIRFTVAQLAPLRDRARIRARLAALWRTRRTEVPWREAGQTFFVESAGGAQQPALYVDRGGAPRLLLDPRTISRDGATAIGDYAVSPDGRWLAYSASPGGADAGETHVRALATGRDLPDVVRGTWGTACFTADGGGFFYMRPQPAAPGATEGARMGKRVAYHVLGRPQDEDRVIHDWPDDVRWIYCMLSDDGRRALIVAERGATAALHAIDLGDPLHPDVAAPFERLLADREGGYTPLGTVGSTLYLQTDLDAPRGQIVAIDLAEGARARARTIIPEADAVIQRATVAGDRLAVHYLVDVTSRLRLFTLDGKPAGEVPLPAAGALDWALNGRGSAPELWYAFSSFLAPSTVYRHDLRTGRSVAFRVPRTPFDGARYATRQIFFTAKDGTRVPMFVTARRDVALDGKNPTLLTAYGGYGQINAPRFRPEVACWLERGGVHALANIRGGGEYGEGWHLAGSGARKQTSFDDLAAAAEALVAAGYTSPAKLAIYGHSNGGMTVGAMIAQRPELFAAAFASAGHHDMLRYHRFTVGAGWIPEYGSPDDPAAFRVLLGYSPLHHVRPGTCYPATMLLAADHDDRVVPSHSYKLAAALQAAQGCDRPILLRVASDASHSYASGNEAISEYADMFAFALAAMGK